jgi:hypothetical protein
MRRLHPHHSSTLTALSETGSSLGPVVHTPCHTPFRRGSLLFVVGRRQSHDEGGLFRVGVGEQLEKKSHEHPWNF